MAVAIEGYSAVGLKSRIEEKFAGGLTALMALVPNATGVTDDDLWRCSFMVCAEAEQFLGRLQQSGMECVQGPDSDAVLVNEFDLSVAPYCEWLQVTQWEKGVIAWLSGTTPQSVVAREGWSPEKGSGLTFAASINNENLQFLRMDGNIAVYFDKERGCEVYIGRTDADPDEIYKVSARVIFEHRVNPGEPLITGDAQEKVRQATTDLENLVETCPDEWRIFLMIGIGKQALGDLNAAYAALRRAFELEQETEAVPREFAGVCLQLGKTAEAVQIEQKAAALKPDNPETLGNLACAYLMDGKHQEAATTIRAALKLSPSDRINLHLQRVINDVISGSRPQPGNLAELSNPTQPENERQSKPGVRKNSKKSLWDRLCFWKR